MAYTSDKPYEVYHLKRDVLEAMERGSAENINKEAVEHYTGLLSNAPRTNASDYKEKKAAASKARMTRKCTSVKALMQQGYYEKVCSIDVDCASQVIELTNDVNELWYEKYNKKMDVHTDKPRSTTHYDLVVRFGRPFIFMPLGFIDLGGQVYADGIV